MKLAIVLTTGLDSQDRRTARGLAEAALDQGHEVSIFLNSDGCYAAGELSGLAERGAFLVCCAKSAEARHLPDIASVHGSTQFVCASLVAEADRVVTLG